MDIIEALKIIIAKSPRAGEEAIRTIAAARNKSPILQARYSNVLIRAFADPEANFTPEERETLAAGIEAPNTGNRGYTIQVRLNTSEYASISGSAEMAGQSISEYVRQKLFEKDQI